METIYFCTPRFLLLMNSYSQRLYFAQGKQSEKEKIEEASFEECCWSGFKFLKLFQEIQNCFFRWTRQDWWKCLQKQSGLYSSLSTTMLPAFLLEIHFDPGNCKCLQYSVASMWSIQSNAIMGFSIKKIKRIDGLYINMSLLLGPDSSPSLHETSRRYWSCKHW